MPARWTAYAGASTALAAGVVLKALHQRPNFYSACVYLAQSNANLMILTNFVFLIVCAVLVALQKLLYGPLRPIEIEQLYEKGWFAVTETCLAMTIFPRGELGGWFLVMFFSLLAGKVWSWIGEGRVEFLEQQPPSNPRLFHTRLALSLSLSILFNSYLLEYCVTTVLRQARPDMMVMFGFEFAVLTITSTSTAARYAISLAEIVIIRKQKQEIIDERRREMSRRRETEGAEVADADAEIDEMELDVPGWEEKGRYVFYLDLLTDFLKLNTYLAFFTILLTFYGLPIHIIRDVFFTCRSFVNRIKDFMRYRSATRDMNERYPDATPEEVTAADVCIICREEMVPWPPPSGTDASAQAETESGRRMRRNVAERMRPKKLPCGHVLHFSCLRSWLERQQNCPTCRRPVLDSRRATGQGAQGNGPVGQDGHPPGQDHHDNQNPDNLQNRARIINFGPLRIGFGAGRGNLFNDLAQQVQNGQARPAANANVEPGVQQYGFGLGWNRNQQGENRNTTPGGSLQEQIRALEQRLQQEINSLNVAVEQMDVIRRMQYELVRLRIANPNGSGTNVPAPLASGVRPPGSFNTGTPLPAQSYTAAPRSAVVNAGSPSLPQGLVLPEGWSMLPLHRFDQMQPAQFTSTHPAFSQPQNRGADGARATPTPSTNNGSFGTVLRADSNSPRPQQSNGDIQRTITPQSSSMRPPNTNTNDVTDARQNQSHPINHASHLNGETSSRSRPTESMQGINVPSWGSANVPPRPASTSRTSEEKPHLANGDGQLESGKLESASLPSSSSSSSQDHDEVAGTDASASAGKGKAKAATVEDFIEDVD